MKEKSALEYITQGYSESEKNAKPFEVRSDFVMTKKRIEEGHYVPPVEMISLGFHELTNKNTEEDGE